MRKQPFSRQSDEKRDFVLKIAIVDDLKLDAEQLSHLIFSYYEGAPYSYGCTRNISKW